jgi:hypothetical protein
MFLPNYVRAWSHARVFTCGVWIWNAKEIYHNTIIWQSATRMYSWTKTWTAMEHTPDEPGRVTSNYFLVDHKPFCFLASSATVEDRLLYNAVPVHRCWQPDKGAQMCTTCSVVYFSPAEKNMYIVHQVSWLVDSSKFSDVITPWNTNKIQNGL